VTSQVTTPAAVAVTTDLALGGRWTSLRSSSARGHREWLWGNPRVPLAERASVRPGTRFVDAGGGEECLPSVVGAADLGHDHGDVWCRPWVGEPSDAAVRTRDGLTLRRRVGERAGAVRVHYDITGPPGTGLLHAVHLLLDVSDEARLQLPRATEVEVQVQDRPSRGRHMRTVWPDGDGARLDVLGPADGTARCAVVASDAVDVLDGRDRLSLRWGAPPGVPVSLVVWRNLGGWPVEAPYRSIGVEPMIGAGTDVAAATPRQLATIGDEGSITWWLEVSASSA
jgi:hypothetical protein